VFSLYLSLVVPFAFLVPLYGCRGFASDDEQFVSGGTVPRKFSS
ncbi:hypothetical protein A2U01_0080446, partial [Trifolium medium]|nr:hypothetical protein [Trifolium medium]